MTRDELNRRRMMFQIYANRNKMPQLQKNDNEEPLKHSATNEYLEYRKKVAAGMKMQRDNRPSDLFNVTEANEQYYQDLMDQNIIIHAGTYKPTGTHEYIAVLPDFWGKGKHRYFYTQQEWDNYQKNAAGARQAGADRGAKEGADARNKALANAGQKAYADARKNSTNAVINNAKNDLKNKALAEAGQKAFENSQKNNALTTAQSRREAAIANSQGGSKEDASDVTNTVKNYNASRKEYEKNAQANPEAQRAQKMRENAEREETDNISNTVKNYNASKREWEKNAQANPEAQRGAKESERANAQKQAANQSGSANAAKAQGEAYDEYMNNKKQSSNQSGSANAARAEGEGYDRYKKDMAEREAFREESEREALNYQEREGNKKESVASGKNEAQRALKDTASGIANSKNPAKEIASNKTYSKYIDDIVELIDSGAAEIGSDGTIHIDKTKNPRAVYKITNDDVMALNSELLKNGMTQRSINAAVMDEIEKRAKASKENKGQSGVESFMKGSKANKGVSSFMQSSKDSKKAKSKAMSANQSGSGNAAAAEGERRDIERERAAWEEEQRRADAYDIDHGKKKKYASARHDGLEDGITTEDISPEQEYLDFRARVEEGMKHYSMARGLMSIPMNQALAHATPGITNKYYAKLDDFWGKGKPRYFYSKEEWDGYQRNKQGAAQAGAQRGAKEGAHAKNQSLANQAGNAYQSSYRNNLLNKAQSGREAAMNNSGSLVSESSGNTPTPFKNLAQTAKRTALLYQAQSGREAAIKNSGSLGGTNTNNDGSSNVTVVIEKIPENVQIAQSGREEDERAATKRTMINMAYDKAVRDYNEVAKEIDSEYGFDKVESQKDLLKAYTNLIKDTEKVIAKGKVPNPDNVKYESQITGDTAQYAAYIQEYASELLRLESVKQDLQNEYSKTIDLASAQTGDGFVQSHQRATELFNQMMDVNDQINWLSKESMAKVYPYLTAVYRELI